MNKAARHYLCGGQDVGRLQEGEHLQQHRVGQQQREQRFLPLTTTATATAVGDVAATAAFKNTATADATVAAVSVLHCAGAGHRVLGGVKARPLFAEGARLGQLPRRGGSWGRWGRTGGGSGSLLA